MRAAPSLGEPPEVERVEAGGVTRRTPAPRRRVLVVDDEPALVKVLARQLERHYDVDMASTAKDAITRLSSSYYDVVLCDLRLEDEPGIAVYDSVRAHTPEQAGRFIFITGGSSDPEHDGLSRRARATGRPVLEKPFDGPSLEALVARVARR